MASVTSSAATSRLLSFQSTNKALHSADDDTLFHFGIKRSQVDLKAVFGETKFVCTGGSPTRLKTYSALFAEEIGLPAPCNLSRSDRFVIYKTGKVLWINHGMGTPSLSIMLVETFKLLHYAKARDFVLIRIGTSGGVGVDAGSVVVSSGAVNAELREEYTQFIAGKKIARSTVLDAELQKEIVSIASEMGLPAVTGKTFCADDFYEGQMRLDGFFCEYSSEEKFSFLRQLHSLGVRNIEMESSCFAAFTHRAGVKSAIVCVTLLNRMEGDQVNIDPEKHHEYEHRPFQLISSFLKRRLNV